MEILTPDWLGVRVLALDLDHCLGRYRNHALQRLIYCCIVRGLVEKEGWGKAAFAVLPSFHDPAWQPEDEVEGVSCAGVSSEGLDVTDQEVYGVGWSPSFARKGLVFDTRTGDLLQLGPEGQVLLAFHGFTQLSPAEVSARYGAQHWGAQLLLSGDKHPDLCTLTTFFDACAAVSLAQCVVAQDAGAAQPPSEAPLPASSSGAGALAAPPPYQRLLKCHHRVFDHIFDNEPAFASGRGGFFSALRMHPGRYIASRQRAAQALRALQAARACRLLLVTNSSPEYARFVLGAALGPGAASLFDGIFYSSAKPSWFSHTAPPPLRPVAPGAAPPPSLSAQAWGAGAECCGGSADAVVAAYGGEGLLFAGDHVLTDVYAARQCQLGAWATVAVVEELEEEAAAGGERGPWLGFRQGLFGSMLAAHASVLTADVTLLLEQLARERGCSGV